MNSNEAADQVVSMTLKGIEIIAKLTGAGAKNLATYLYAVLRDQKKTRGKTRLEGLLRSGKELKVFAVKTEDLRRFVQEAKRYGVLYCALRDKKSIDGMCDIMVRAEDASKINRIVERFKLATVDTASIKSEIERSRAAKHAEKATTKRAPAKKEPPGDISADAFLDDILAKSGRTEPEISYAGRPTTATTEKPLPSEPTSGRSGSSVKGTNDRERRSVRQELNDIRAGHRAQAQPERAPAKGKEQGSSQPTPTAQSKPKNKKVKKER
jgi:hypothetical protein